MSLSPLVSFKSRFVTYLLNFPRTTITVRSPYHSYLRHNSVTGFKKYREDRT